ncbi:hypothetical protein TNCV_1723141 [Trichonephila clavipes]|nr:hypothetical protein TNCV_1723141 [Trichonephila clavipes]
MPISVSVTLGAEVHEQMSRSGSQSGARPQVFSPQASLILICRSTEGTKGRVNPAPPEDRIPDLCDRPNLLVMVTNSRVIVPLRNRRRDGVMHIKSHEDQIPPVGVLWKFGEGASD